MTETTNQAITLDQEIQDVWEENTKLLLSDRHGVCIPQIFKEGFSEKFHIGKEEFHTTYEFRNGCLKNLDIPENEGYWESWNYILSHTYCTSKVDGRVYNLHHNGDL